MRIAHLIAPVSFGGGESLLVNLLKQRRPGLDEMVVSVYTSAPFNALLDSAGVAHSELRPTSIGHGLPRWRMGLDTVRTAVRIPRMISILKSAGVDVVHAHGFPASSLYAAARAQVGAPGIYTHHFYRRPPGMIERALLGRVYAAYARITGVSDLVSSSFITSFGLRADRVATIHNCVGEEFFVGKPDPAYVDLFADKITFVQVARFVPFKNQELVIDALSRLPELVRRKLRVVFVGEGPQRRSVERMAAARRVGDSAVFLGAVPYPRLPGLLAAADFGLFPSANEGFGIGAAECLAAGLPVLCLDNELMREIVGPGGIRSPQDRLEEGFVRMMETGNDMRLRASEWARSRYHPAVIKDRYLSLYNNILSDLSFTRAERGGMHISRKRERIDSSSRH